MKVQLAILGAVVLLWLVAAVFLSQLDAQRAALVAVPPTRTLKPTYTATATASPTLSPSPTPTPSNTPSLTPPPTDTPSPTLSPTASHTPTSPPTPTATNTRQPTPQPTRRPTNTPVPQPTRTPASPFAGTVVGGSARCDGYQGVEGHVRHADDSPYPDVAIGIWTDSWWGTVTRSEPDGKYSFNLMNLPAGKFKLAVVRYETCGVQSELRTANACQRQSGIVEITLTENCTGADATQVAAVDFKGP